MKHPELTQAEAESFESPLLDSLPPAIVQNGKVRTAVLEQLKPADLLIFREKGKLVLAGPRFRKANAGFAFVHLTANFELTEKELLVLRETVHRSFPPVKFHGLTFRQAPGTPIGLPHERWAHTLFGKLSELPAPEGPPRIELSWEKDTRFFPEYEKEYRAYLGSQPSKRLFMSPESLADFQSAVEQGLVLGLYDQDGWGGLIAGQRRAFYGLPCLYLFENFIAERLRGQRLAGTLQRSFFSGLATRFSHVFGHIDDSNQASLKTALSMNRTIIETEYFMRASELRSSKPKSVSND